MKLVEFSVHGGRFHAAVTLGCGVRADLTGPVEGLKEHYMGDTRFVNFGGATLFLRPHDVALHLGDNGEIVALCDREAGESIWRQLTGREAPPPMPSCLIHLEELRTISPGVFGCEKCAASPAAVSA